MLGLVLVASFSLLLAKLALRAAPAAASGQPPQGYYSQKTMLAAYALGELKLIDKNPPLPDGVREEKDIEYGRVGETSLKLDLFSPKTLDSPSPALLFIHGGGWKSGQRQDYRVYTTHFASLGYVTATMSYRLGPKGHFPAPIEDANCAVRWIRANAVRLHVDPDRIVVLGGSAGGHIALMVAYASDRPEFQGNGGNSGVSSRVAAVVNFYGPVDLTTPFAQASGLVKTFLSGKTFTEAPELYRAASPLFYLGSNAPPTLTFHGTLDDIVPIDQAETLELRLSALRVPHDYVRMEGWPHTLDVAKPVNEFTQVRIQEFLNKHLSRSQH